MILAMMMTAALATGAPAKERVSKAAHEPMRELSRSDLMSGTRVPERREFPLNDQVPACQDFYEHVCSKVRESFTLPDDRSNWTFSFTDAAERLLDAKKNFFKAMDAGYVPKAERARQTRDYYQACMNEKAAKVEERARVASEKKTILGLKSNDELADLAQRRIDTADETFLSFFDLANQGDPIHNDLGLWVDGRSLPERSYYDKEDVMKDFEALVADFFKTIGMDHPADRARHVVAFEKELAHKAPLPSEIRTRFSDNTYFDRKEWVKAYPRLKLDRFLATIPASVPIRRIAPETFEFFEQALASRPLNELKDVFLFHSLSDVMDDAYPAFFRKKFEFSMKHLGGPVKRPDRQERCTKETMRRFSMEIDEELVPILFPGFPEQKIVELAARVRSSLDRALDRNDWLSKDARKEAKRKIETMHLFLVKPSREEDWNFHYVAKYDSKKPLANRRLWQEKALEKTLKELPEARNRDRWEMGPLVVNAYYDSSDNKFVLLQGILQYPFFDPNGSEVANFGAIGSIIGHEMGHGIDDEGSKFDADGKVRQWMPEKDLAEFKKRGGQFVERFDKIGHNGKLTLGENIGDHVGISSGYAAAFPEPSKAKPEDERQFFVAWARTWCQKGRPAFLEQLLKTDPHALGSARVNEQVIHLAGFSHAFGCKAGDKMYLPEKERIRVW